MAKRYWLMKSEPSAYSIEDWERDGVTAWENIRNYTARNSLRDDVQVGDGVLFYHSSADPTGVAGAGTVARAGYPDGSAQRKGDDYFDPKASADNPIWYAVDIKFGERFKNVVTLDELKKTKGLEEMVVTTKKGQRLSVQPVTPGEFEIVMRIGKRG
jgi:predicted RNA-binding protein with PUA-like domain